MDGGKVRREGERDRGKTCARERGRRRVRERCKMLANEEGALRECIHPTEQLRETRKLCL